MISFILLGIGSLIAWGAWIVVLLRFDPFVNSIGVHAIFYASLGLALFGTLILLGIFWHQKRTGMVASKSEVGIIARQAFLFVFFMLILLGLAAINVLKWWSILPLALLTFTIELFFASLGRQGRTR